MIQTPTTQPGLDSLPSLLTTSEAAKALGLSEKTLHNWRWTGNGPKYRKIGGRVRYTREELAQFIEAGTRTSTSDKGPQGGPNQ